HGGGGGAVARDVVGLLGDFLDQLGADLLVRVLQLDLLGDGNPIVGDRGSAPLLLKDDVAALGAQRHLYRVGEGVEAPLEAATGLFVIRNCLGHCEVIPPIRDRTFCGRAQCPRRTAGMCSACAAPASPSRPSTHRSRVPTAFLALDHGECKIGHTVRRPSRTTSVSRSADSGFAAWMAKQPTSKTFTSRTPISVRAVPASWAAFSRSPSIC